MYITTNIPKPGSQPEPVVCAAVCEQPLSAYFTLLGLLFGIISLAAYLAKKKFFLHIRSPKKKRIALALTIAFWTGLILFVLYFLKIEYSPSGECPIDGLLLSARLLPDFLEPIFMVR